MCKRVLSVLVVLCAIAATGCTRTQVAENAKGAGGALAETLIVAALDVAFGTRATDNLSQAELEECGPTGSCLVAAQRKDQSTRAHIERARQDYARLVGPADSSLSASFSEWVVSEQDADTSMSETRSVMLERTSYQVTDEMIEALPTLTLR